MNEMALVLQGGGALGAYEYGVVCKLVEMGWKPVAVTGVSIGAVNAAAIAGAKNGDIGASLDRVWKAITLETLPWLPASMQGNLSLLGNPNFWRSRTDYLQMASWDSLCSTAPMVDTLLSSLDFSQLNDSNHMRMAVTATSLRTGGPTTFSNYLADDAHEQTDGHQALQDIITPAHILASGALPPGFPAVRIDDCAYWDGGLFSNTPIDALLNLLEPHEIENLPIFTVDLFRTDGLAAPQNLIDVQTRALALQYENRFWAAYGGEAQLAGFLDMLVQLDEALPSDSAVRKNRAYAWLRRLRALKNIQIIEGAPAAAGSGNDFSAYGVRMAYEAGRAAAATFRPGSIQPPQLHAVHGATPAAA
ncbi:patatin-like phospholipase family protein [Massilia sp. S19_KUP03_FR1]|uniref:patatin-like phospholipase family protein n=1 Tax=Massilia sp. S19_KUP03_FR1 TaxID=3025503 RepID=UPI002FCCC75B